MRVHRMKMGTVLVAIALVVASAGLPTALAQGTVGSDVTPKVTGPVVTMADSFWHDEVIEFGGRLNQWHVTLGLADGKTFSFKTIQTAKNGMALGRYFTDVSNVNLGEDEAGIAVGAAAGCIVLAVFAAPAGAVLAAGAALVALMWAADRAMVASTSQTIAITDYFNIPGALKAAR
ncbi:hypothetical protein [Alicyclobacillus sp. ALC3]|uniref:hypothetical protein n=1 Tax=Alicyclobacillus sp. ALC3 TaxID=2796143 RepID=UPI002379F1F1|nr:hypothetical protein [Alicyclobacillus sp. ALC3]WDL95635.1 hypothetical protein JC200_14765 [Alicyclobacillus sp. ALC3]